jgi:hypothetical protein
MSDEKRRYKLQFRTDAEKQAVINFATRTRPVRFDSLNSYIIFLIRQDQAVYAGMNVPTEQVIANEAGHRR